MSSRASSVALPTQHGARRGFHAVYELLQPYLTLADLLRVSACDAHCSERVLPPSTVCSADAFVTLARRGRMHPLHAALVAVSHNPSPAFSTWSPSGLTGTSLAYADVHRLVFVALHDAAATTAIEEEVHRACLAAVASIVRAHAARASFQVGPLDAPSSLLRLPDLITHVARALSTDAVTSAAVALHLVATVCSPVALQRHSNLPTLLWPYPPSGVASPLAFERSVAHKFCLPGATASAAVSQRLPLAVLCATFQSLLQPAVVAVIGRVCDIISAWTATLLLDLSSTSAVRVAMGMTMRNGWVGFLATAIAVVATLADDIRACATRDEAVALLRGVARRFKLTGEVLKTALGNGPTLRTIEAALFNAVTRLRLDGHTCTGAGCWNVGPPAAAIRSTTPVTHDVHRASPVTAAPQTLHARSASPPLRARSVSPLPPHVGITPPPPAIVVLPKPAVVQLEPSPPPLPPVETAASPSTVFSSLQRLLTAPVEGVQVKFKSYTGTDAASVEGYSAQALESLPPVALAAAARRSTPARRGRFTMALDDEAEAFKSVTDARALDAICSSSAAALTLSAPTGTVIIQPPTQHAPTAFAGPRAASFTRPTTPPPPSGRGRCITPPQQSSSPPYEEAPPYPPLSQQTRLSLLAGPGTSVVYNRLALALAMLQGDPPPGSASSLKRENAAAQQAEDPLAVMDRVISALDAQLLDWGVSGTGSASAPATGLQ